MQRPYLAISDHWIEIQKDNPVLIRFDRSIHTIIESGQGIAVYVPQNSTIQSNKFKHTDRGYVCMYSWDGILMWRKPTEDAEISYEKQIVGLSTRNNKEGGLEIGLIGYDCFTYYVFPENGEFIEKVEGR